MRVLGTMSGTSMDGVDAAIIETDGEHIYGFGESAFLPYSAAERDVIRSALGAWPEDDGVTTVAEVVETAHARLLATFADVDLIGFHGQTLAHDPVFRGTHQAGSGEILAEVLERPVVWDFRSADVELGGQGAPLAPFYHFALAKWLNCNEPVAFLNLGGVGNLTWINPMAESPLQADGLLAFDTGPANAPIDDLMMARFGERYDGGGSMAGRGRVDQSIVERFLKHPFFSRMPPKSLDRNDFERLVADVAGLNGPDAAATLTAAAALAVSEGVRHCPSVPQVIYVAGGGRHNATLMAMLRASIDTQVIPVEDVGLDGDMIEAQAFGFLAARVVRGLPTSGPNTTGVRAAVCGGTLSRPGK